MHTNFQQVYILIKDSVLVWNFEMITVKQSGKPLKGGKLGWGQAIHTYQVSTKFYDKYKLYLNLKYLSSCHFF